MKVKNKSIRGLLAKYQEISKIGSIEALLSWDLNVNLPPKAAHFRGEQISYLSAKIVDIFLDGEFKKLLDEANLAANLLPEEAAIVRNLNKASEFYHKVPKEIILELSRTTSEAYVSWDSAKKNDKFGEFLPSLKKITELEKIIAGHIGFKKNPMDALLDMHEPGLTAEFCRDNIVSLQPKITELVKKIQKSKGYVPKSDLVNSEKTYPMEAQKQLANFIAGKMGYDLAAGRIDVSSHPFTIDIGRQDVRITNMYKDADFRDSFTSTMHETGHALYEQNINEDYTGTPLAGGVSFGMHEALSRFWENLIGRNPAFLKFMAPIFSAFYGEQLRGTSQEALVRVFNLVAPSFVRIEADEVTYTLHIILRFELEDEIMNGKLKVADLPEAWRAKMKKYLGIVPPTDREGVLQDMHWSGGSFGYFPAYALGNLYGAQIYYKMKETINVEKSLEQGHLADILYWLNEKVHKYGSLYWPDELIKKSTGKSLDSSYFVKYLEEKYGLLYKI